MKKQTILVLIAVMVVSAPFLGYGGNICRRGTGGRDRDMAKSQIALQKSIRQGEAENNFFIYTLLNEVDSQKKALKADMGESQKKALKALLKVIPEEQKDAQGDSKNKEIVSHKDLKNESAEEKSGELS